MAAVPGLFSPSEAHPASSRDLAEGHAQWVASRVAQVCGLSRAFRELCYVIDGVGCGEEDAQGGSLGVGEEESVYARGLRLVDAAFCLGGPELIDDLLANPPSLPARPEEQLHALRQRAAAGKRPSR